ncbi:hypothetical protein IFR04_006827 [Cadophora malorum]|uniref:Uncharacterized protein n=1 Tax=Cadophora malorum TaxID=108018 RepID=A0A8H7TJR7_9HELO|nr:hypothetical protein IFR04_006827 [Cadophora malorum]
MQLTTLLFTSFFTFSAAFAIPDPAPRPQARTAPGAMCFDAGVCILSGGGMCNKTAGQVPKSSSFYLIAPQVSTNPKSKLLGTCTPPAPGATPNPIPGIPGLPAPAPSSSPAASPAASRAGAWASGAGSRSSSAATALATGLL